MADDLADPLCVLLVSNGMACADLAMVIDSLKEDSKKISSHKRRDLFWQAYSKMGAKVSGMDGDAHFMLTFKVGGGASSKSRLEKAPGFNKNST